MLPICPTQPEADEGDCSERPGERAEAQGKSHRAAEGSGEGK